MRTTSEKDLDHPWIDLSLAPLYLQEFPSEFSLEEFKDYLQAVERIMRNTTGKIAWVVDLSKMVVFGNALYRKALADSEKRMAEFDAKYTAGIALHAPNPVVRKSATAVYWLAPPVYPFKIVSTREEGIAWAKQQLRDAGVQI